MARRSGDMQLLRQKDNPLPTSGPSSGRLRISTYAGARADILFPWNFPVQHLACLPVRPGVGRFDARRRSLLVEGVVLCTTCQQHHPIHRGLPLMDSSASMLARLRNSMAVGFSRVSPKRHDGEFQRKSSRFIDPPFHEFGDIPQMRGTGRQFRPGIANADHRTAIEKDRKGKP